MGKVYLRKRDRKVDNILDLEICINITGENLITKKIGWIYIDPSLVQRGCSHNQNQLVNAERIICQKVNELRQQNKVQKSTGVTNFTEFFRKRAEKKKGQYLYCFKKFIQYFESELEFQYLDYGKMLGFYEYLCELSDSGQISINTANCYFQKFSGTVSEAVRQGFLSNNSVVLKGMKRKKGFSVPKIRLEINEFDALRQINPTNKYEDMAKELYLIGVLTGLRISDILSIRRKDISIDENGVYYVSKTQCKTGKVIHQYFIEEAGSILKKYLSCNSSEIVFGHLRYNSVVNDALRDLISRIRIGGGIILKRISLGSARNTHATLLYRKTNDIILIKESLGHSGYKYIDSYVNTTNEQKLEKLKSTFAA